MDELIGPFYDMDGLVEWLGRTKQAIGEQTRDGRLIGMQDAAGRWVYPTWQFDGAGAVHPPLIEVWQLLRTEADPWTAAEWMCVRNPDTGGRIAADWLISGEDPEPVMCAARDDVGRWSW
ncbi:hypothetical protein [Tsukamurella pseudospumae]|uniref:Uncharacterized protein n=1 Tax=Tsukamurella pseudospumae TaxID=239498 RepID=A0A137YSJ1_9ACTN|nr:hypothetical protein [Tsukamurella pseudospumae]KXO88888.1 hypothetical protein AXK61_09540 [Tsukamurella pseudospumae]